MITVYHYIEANKASLNRNMIHHINVGNKQPRTLTICFLLRKIPYKK